jgi:hypothetical protein
MSCSSFCNTGKWTKSRIPVILGLDIVDAIKKGLNSSHGKITNTYRVLVRKPEGKRTFAISKNSNDE